MSRELEKTGKHQVEVHFVNAGVPCLIEENFEGYYLEYGDTGLQDLLQDQETVYQSLHANSGNEITKASASTESSPDTKESGGNRKMENEGESSQGDAVESQLALDEAMARALQELEDQLARTSFSESTGTESDKDDPSSARQERTPTQDSTVNREHNSADTNSVASQDGIDPDNMTYELSVGYCCLVRSCNLLVKLLALRAKDCQTSLFPICHLSNTKQDSSQEKKNMRNVSYVVWHTKTERF